MTEGQLETLKKVVQCLEWYVQEDDTNLYGEWEEKNAYWIAGQNRAIAALTEAKLLLCNNEKEK